MAKLLGLNFSARAGGNLWDLAHDLLAKVAPGRSCPVLTTCEPGAAAGSDQAQQLIRATVGLKLVSFEQIVPSAYGLNALYQRLVQHPGIQGRLTAMSDHLVMELSPAGAPAV